MQKLNYLKSCKILAAGDKSNLKPTLLCHTGKFQGMFGPVEVTLQDLQKMVSKYTEVRGEPANEFDYAPILKDHVRAADNTVGRLMLEGLEVKPWKTKNSVQEYGLYGNLRIDDEVALEKVNKGLYANVSVTFDEDTLEIMEVSFVAVEAARGSIVLSKGEKTMKRKTKALSQSGAKQSALSLAVTAHRTTRATSLAAHSGNLKSLSAQVTELVTKSNAIALSIKTGQVKNRFVDFIKQGKMNPVELLKLDPASLSQLPEVALSAVFSSYDARTPSKDIFQFGQSSEKSVVVEISHEKMREAIKLQKTGKGVKSLAAGEEKVEDDKKLSAEDQEKAKEMMKSYSMSEDEFKKCLEDMDAVSKQLSGVMEKITAMGGDVEKMQADDKKSDEVEKLAAEEDEKESLAAADDEDEKQNKKENE